MKRTQFKKTLLFFAATVAIFGMTACSGSDDNIIGDEPITGQPGTVKTYQVSIPATMPSDGQTRAMSFDGTTSTGTFASTEKVYVYNATTGAMLSGYLQPSNITTDGKGSDLTGTLTGAISSGDNLTLLYNLSHYSDELAYCYFDYDDQNGTQSGVVDGALATVTASGDFTGGVLTTTAPASFQNMQSMFRFKFVDESGAPITVATLLIQSTGWDITAYYWPFESGDDRYGANSMVVTPASPTSDYLYVAICINEDESASALEFTATDASGNEYKGTKTAPTGGFKNGKYYYNTSAIALTKQDARIAPTITWTSVENGTTVTPDEYNCYSVWGPWNGSSYSPSEISITGTSSGYWFYMCWGSTIHLNGLTATYDEDDDFIYSAGDLTLDISGTNSITCKNFYQAIFVDGTLKLSGSGTLTVTANYAGRYGIVGNSNYIDSNNGDASVVAADGYTVTRSARTDNGDGTYTWTYTVTPNN